jgi:surface carbohydrate biosynthesis protein
MSNFLFPIETTARELDHKILMAVLSAKKDRKIYIGDQQIIRTLSFLLKGGVYYGKHLFGKPSFSDQKYYNRIKKNKFNLVHLNEEGAVWAGTSDDWQATLNQCERPSVLASDDSMAMWGLWQKEHNLSYENPTVNIQVTGHPKFDLYRSKYKKYFCNESEVLKNKYGDYILINTAFSLSNNGKGGEKFIFEKKGSYDSSNLNHRKYLFGDWENQMHSMASIVYLINKISLEFPDKNIILRPHPSENTEYYNNIFQNIDNVKVIYEGSVTPWILACSILIHNGCTTSIEASLANKPVINFTSKDNSRYEVFLAGVCGKKISNADLVLTELKKLYVDGEWDVSYTPNDDKSRDLFHNFQEENSSLEVLKLLEKADVNREYYKVRKLSKLSLSFISLFHRAYLIAKFSYMLFKGKRANVTDYLKRFERFDKEDIEERVQKMSAILGKEVKITYQSAFLFVIELV